MVEIVGSVTRQRKFTLAMLFSIISSIALFADKLTGSEYVSAITFILGLYGMSNVGQRWVESK